MTSERLQKILAQAGYGPRRACEDFITAGRVRVNGQLAELGQKADPAVDKITVDGKAIAAAEKLNYIALYKPRNVPSTVEKEKGDDRHTVRELVEESGHLYPVGRLDFESEGLILMTNDGDLANRLTHPRYGHENSWKYHTGQSLGCTSTERILLHSHQACKRPEYPAILLLQRKVENGKH